MTETDKNAEQPVLKHGSEVELDWVDPAGFEPHPLSLELYGDPAKTCTPEFLASVANRGVMQPAIVSRDSGYVLAGCSRRYAAEIADRQLPVIWVDARSELEQKIIVIETNRQRVKTRDQINREIATLAELLEERNRMWNSSGRVDGDDTPEQSKKAEIAERVGVSERQVKQTLAVQRQIRKLRVEGRDEDADKLQATLDSSGHTQAVRQMSHERPVAAPDEQTDSLSPLNQGDPGGRTEAREASPAVSSVAMTSDPKVLASPGAAVLQLLDAVAEEVKKLSGYSGWERLNTAIQADVNSHLKAIRSAVNGAKPVAVCTRCKGAGCETCNGSGVVSSVIAKQQRDEQDRDEQDRGEFDF